MAKSDKEAKKQPEKKKLRKLGEHDLTDGHYPTPAAEEADYAVDNRKKRDPSPKKEDRCELSPNKSQDHGKKELHEPMVQ